jgi:DNA-binding transcriptional LysR family regulator
MRGAEFAEMAAFLSVAEHRSFTKAALRLGLSKSTVTQSVRSLEDRLGVRLLNRTTRSVATTEIGDFLLTRLRPAFDDVTSAVDQLNDFRDKPAGLLRIATLPMAANLLLGPMMGDFLREYPDIRLDISLDYARPDIIAERFDAGIRIGEHIEKDMIAVRLGGPIRPAVVAAPAYFARHPPPQVPQDLQKHDCIRFRYPNGDITRWRFSRKRQTKEIRVTGRVTLNDFPLVVRAALEGVGIAYLPPYFAVNLVAEGRLVQVLEDWMPSYSGFFLYYSSKRQVPATLKALIKFLQKPRGQSRERNLPSSGSR